MPPISSRKTKLISLMVGPALAVAPFATNAATDARGAGLRSDDRSALEERASRDERRQRVSDELLTRIDSRAAGELDVIVTYQSRPGTFQRAKAERLGGAVSRSFKSVRAQALRLPVGAVSELAADPDVAWVSLDAPLVGSLDHARQVAGLPDPASTNLPWTGAGVTVAVIDSGVAAHADLDNLLMTVDFTNSAGSGDWHDGWGHGTHVAGIIAGSGDESNGMYRGIAPSASVISLRVLDDAGVGMTSDAIAAIEWAIEHRHEYGIRVLNLSLGHPVLEAAANDPLVQAVEAAWSAGLVVVCSAGNRGANGYFTINSPGNSSRVITVGSLTDWDTTTTDDDAVSSYSSLGPTLLDHFAKPDVIAPGNRIVSTRAAGSAIDAAHADWRVTAAGESEASYLEMSGTSMAAPMVAGAVALMLEKETTLNPDSVKARLMKSADKMHGRPYENGAGVLSVAAVLEMGGYAEVAASPQVYRMPSGVIFAPAIGPAWGAGWNENQIWQDAAMQGDSIDWGHTDDLGGSSLWNLKPKNVPTQSLNTSSWADSLPAGD